MRTLLVCLVLALLAGSGVVSWTTWVESDELRVTGCVADCMVQVELQAGWVAPIWVDARVMGMTPSWVLKRGWAGIWNDDGGCHDVQCDSANHCCVFIRDLLRSPGLRSTRLRSRLGSRQAEEGVHEVEGGTAHFRVERLQAGGEVAPLPGGQESDAETDYRWVQGVREVSREGSETARL